MVIPGWSWEAASNKIQIDKLPFAAKVGADRPR